MEKNLISIIIPCYNHEKYVVNCLKSIVDDNYEKKEIIILDDGSKDSSVSIIKKFIKQYDPKESFIHLYTQDNRGVVKTLNKLVDLANGEYIAILASDDELRNNGLSKRIEYLQCHTDKKAVIGNAVVIDAESNILKENAAVNLYRANGTLLKNEKYFNTELILQWSVVGPCLLLKKEVYTIIGKYNESYITEDKDFYLRLIENNLLGYLDETVSAYRVHGLNMSIFEMPNRIRLECAKINVNHAKYQKKLIERLYLKSYCIDKLFLTKKIMFLYWGNKIIRYVFVLLYRIILTLLCKK